MCKEVVQTLIYISNVFLQTFEDMEFHQMEEEAHKQTEREELLKEIGSVLQHFSYDVCLAWEKNNAGVFSGRANSYTTN